MTCVCCAALLTPPSFRPFASGGETLEEDSHHENTGVDFDGQTVGGPSSQPTTAVHSRNGSIDNTAGGVPKGVRRLAICHEVVLASATIR